MTTSMLVRTSPEDQGVASSAIMGFVNAAEDQVRDLHSFMLLRYGKVVAEGWWEPYGREHPHVLFSLSKSFTSTAVGLAVHEGRLSVEDPVIRFFPEDCPRQISENLAAMQVRHLLTMSTGHDQDPTHASRNAQEGNWARAFLAQPIQHIPGTHFVYNSLATYMLSAIVQKLTGMTLLDYLTPRLFQPLGIEGPTWEKCPRGINTGGWGLSIRTEDIARFGQLYLNQGVWAGKQLIPADWIAEATAKHISNGSDPNNDWNQGYGYQFWRCRHNVYRGDGAFGQYCIVMPDQDAVLAITSGLSDMGAVLNLVWKHLLPAMGPAAVPADAKAQCRLQDKLESLRIAPVQGARTSSLAPYMAGMSCLFEPNDLRVCSVKLEMTREGCRVITRGEQSEHAITFGHGTWVRGMALFNGESVPVAASYGWTSEDTWVGKMYFYHTPFCQIVTCKVEGDRVTMQLRQNVSFGPTEWPALDGRLV